jgi:hypothetical protein
MDLWIFGLMQNGCARAQPHHPPSILHHRRNPGITAAGSVVATIGVPTRSRGMRGLIYLRSILQRLPATLTRQAWLL